MGTKKNYHLATGDKDLEFMIDCFEKAFLKKDFSEMYGLFYELIGYCVGVKKLKEKTK